MPSLIDQMKVAAGAGGVQAPFYVARILTPLGMNYQEVVKRFQPYDRIQQVNEQMRQDVVRLAKRAIQRQVPAFVIINNRCEGNAPLGIEAIQEMLNHE